MTMKIQESAENYLETILILSEKNAHVRSIDIATELHFTKPSVSVAMKSCARTISSAWTATALSRSRKAAWKSPRACMSGTGCFRLARLSRRVARNRVEDACRIEHVISQESFEKIRAHVTEMKELL